MSTIADDIADAAAPGPATDDIALTVTDVVVEYPGKSGPVRAVHGVSLTLRRGETLGLVGESGCGKSSTGRAIVQLPAPTSGHVWLGDEDLTTLSKKRLRSLRRKIQLIFQDPIASLNPRKTAQETVAESLSIRGVRDADAQAISLLSQVGVDEMMAKRKPHELSGGQCQRISIARALAQTPEVLVCDEPVSALDVSVQAQVLNLLETMKAEYGLSMIFISHDLAVVGNISDRIAVMYLGRICEIADSRALYSAPRHHYTKLLLDSIPDPEGSRDRKTTPVASRSQTSAGCPFAPRCPAAQDRCRSEVPELTPDAEGHLVACHFPLSSPAASPAAAH
ncbi:ABC transporter ATP-binding protein [Microbacterium caowuchunii]|uniref:ABC transporter ATP-binding protein n=1 Tax=Microbacterium caowuchunii TaxID=2614638 RepID=UPI0012443043|nr:ABC transporter ATP-binding protein [Microbacterium caowuchunii]QEW01252.1 ABC transporter ATP-binding protein [Microbacterium caowuchunii]